MTFTSPSPRLWLVRRLQLVVVTLLVAVAAGIVAYLASSTSVVLVVLAGVLLLALVSWSGLRGRYRAWGYAEREDDLLVRRGVLVRRLSVIPYGRMQFIDVTAGPVERAFGLATVQLHTAAAATDARIPGLARPEAERLRDRLAALGEARAQGL